MIGHQVAAYEGSGVKPARDRLAPMSWPWEAPPKLIPEPLVHNQNGAHTPGPLHAIADLGRDLVKSLNERKVKIVY